MLKTLSKKHLGYFLGAILALSFAAITLVGAVNVQAQALTPDELFGGEEGPTGAEFADSAGLGDAALVDTIAAIIRIALGFLGVLSVVIILIGGFKWITSGGNDDKVKSAKKLIFSGIIGLVIILAAYAIASFVIESLVGVTSGEESSGGSSG